MLSWGHYLMLLGENSHRTLGLEVLNFKNLRLTAVSLSVCQLNPTCFFTTDSLGSVGGVFLKMKLLTVLRDGKRFTVSSLLSPWIPEYEQPHALEQAVLVGNTSCSAFGSVSLSPPWGHFFLCLYPSFTWALPNIFLALGHPTRLSLFPSSLPESGNFTLAGFPQVSRVAVPGWHGLNQKPELNLRRTWDLTAPRSWLPPLLVALGWAGRQLPGLPGRQRLALVRWLPACSAHRQAQSCADFLAPRHQPCLGTGFQLCSSQRQTGPLHLGSWSFFHKAWRWQETSSWPCLWVGSVSCRN